MSKFQFRNSELKLDIAGQIFTIHGTARYEQKVVQTGKALEEKARELGGTESPDSFDKAAEFICSQIDVLLGEGASEKIFSGREKEYYDCLEVYNFITEEFTAYQKQRFEKLFPVKK